MPWIRITKTHNQGFNMYSKGELIDRPESQIKLLPADVYEPAVSPYESQVDQAARARDLAKQTFLRLQQESTLAADKLRTAQKAAETASQGYDEADRQCGKLLAEQGRCEERIAKLEGKTGKKDLASFNKQTAHLRDINRQLEITQLVVVKLQAVLSAANTEVELCKLAAEAARKAAEAANPDKAKQEQPADEPEQPEQNEPAGNADPEAAEPKDANNPEGQAVSAQAGK